MNLQPQHLHQQRYRPSCLTLLASCESCPYRQWSLLELTNRNSRSRAPMGFDLHALRRASCGTIARAPHCSVCVIRFGPDVPVATIRWHCSRLSYELACHQPLPSSFRGSSSSILPNILQLLLRSLSPLLSGHRLGSAWHRRQSRSARALAGK